MKQYTFIRTEVKKDIAVVKLNRPQSRNALNSTFFNEMEDYVSFLKTANNIRALIITGEGTAFAAGADIAEMQNLDLEKGRQWSQTGQKVFSDLGTLPFPVIAAINGFALGGGLELAMSCDIRFAASTAKFGQPEVNLGLVPGYAGTQRLSRLTNMSLALYLICTGEMINAQEALNFGLIQKIFEPEELMDKTLEVAGKISSKGYEAVKNAKKLIRQGYYMNIEEASKLESEIFGKTFGTPEAVEGIKAFLEKRKPDFKISINN